MMFLADAGWYSVLSDCLGSEEVGFMTSLAAEGWYSVIDAGNCLDNVEAAGDMDGDDVVVCVSAFTLDEVLALLLSGSLPCVVSPPAFTS